MELKTSTASQNSLFNLKNETVQLVPPAKSERVVMTVQELESMRVGQSAVPASKHGLETICGASCEIGAH